jgi:tetratricopeptide (TPR) repeat protein
MKKEKYSKKKFPVWAWILILVGAILLIYFLYDVVKVSTDYPLSSIAKPMYGYDSYEDYIENIDPTLREQRDQWVINVTKDFGTVKNASIAFINAGWYSLKNEKVGGPIYAMEKFNAAWLLDKDNFNVFWGYGVAQVQMSDVQNKKKLLEKSVKMFDIAITLFNEADEMYVGDKITLYCDAAFSNLLYSDYDDSSIDKAISLTEQALAIDYSKVDSAKVPNLNKSKARCFFFEAEAYAAKNDYTKSWELVKNARNLNPEEYGASNPFVIELSKEMPEPQ